MQHAFQCMILDLGLGLPDLNGFELLERIRKDPSIHAPPVIIHSGRDLSREEFHRLRRYTDAMVMKGSPHSGERLAEEVASLLENMTGQLPTTESAEASGQKDWPAILKGRTVLLVDDDMRNTFALSKTLEKKGLNVIMAPDGQTALELLENAQCLIDAVLMDTMMPGMDGNEATRRIRKRPECRGLPIIALSAKAMAEDRELCLEAGADAFLPKPIDLEQLFALLQKWMITVGGKPA